MSAISPISSDSFRIDFSQSPIRFQPIPQLQTETVSEIVQGRISQGLFDLLEPETFPAQPSPFLETGRSSDVSIAGDGFFGLRLGDEDVFSRSISLGLDTLGNVTDLNSGAQLLQLTDSETGIIADLFGLDDSDRRIDPSPTDALAFVGSLAESLEIGQTISRPSTIFDSSGAPIEIDVQFERVSEDQFVVTISDPLTGDLAFDGRLTFTPDGSISDVEMAELEAENGQSFEALVLSAESGDDVVINADDISFDALTLEGDQTDLEIEQDGGDPGGDLEVLTINEDGELVGEFDGGQRRTFGDVVVAEFQNPEALTNGGNSLLSSNDASGDPSFTPGEAFDLDTGQLELSRSFRTRDLINQLFADRDFIERRNLILQDQGQLVGEFIDLIA